MTMPDELLPEYDLDYSMGRPNRYAGKIDKSNDRVVRALSVPVTRSSPRGDSLAHGSQPRKENNPCDSTAE